MRCHWQWPRRRFQGKCSSTRFVGKTQNTIRWGVRIQLLTHKWLLMDDLTTGGLAGSEELSLAFFALVRGSVVTLVPLLAQVFEANWLACGQIIDTSVWMPPEPSARRRLAGGGGGVAGFDCATNHPLLPPGQFQLATTLLLWIHKQL